MPVGVYPKSEGHRKAISESLKRAYREGRIKHWSKGLTAVTDRRLAYLRDVGRKSAKKLKGKTYEEIYGDRAEEMKKLRSTEASRRDHTAWIKGAEKFREKFRGKTYEEVYGPEKAREIKKRQSKALRGSNNPFFGKHHAEDTRRAIGEKSKRMWKEKKQEIILAQHRKPTSLEIKFDKILQDNFPNEWCYTGDGKYLINELIPDWVNKTGTKVIELFGCYFHGCKQCYPQRSNIPFYVKAGFRKKKYTKAGCDVIFIWEHELKDIENVVQKVKEFRKNNLRGWHVGKREEFRERLEYDEKVSMKEI